MKPSFEKNLGEYSRLTKDQMSAEDAQELEKLQTVVDYHLERAAKTQGTKKEAQEKVFEIQKEKQCIMSHLHDNLRCLDDPDCMPERPPKSRLVTFDEKDNKFFVQMPDDRQESATLGDILTDGDWGLVYYLDTETVPRMAQKKFFVENAKRELRDLLDEQIVVGMAAIQGQNTPGFRGTLNQRRILKHFIDIDELSTGEKIGIHGFAAELVVKNFFQQLCINELAPFRVIEADVYQDAQEKIDFILHIEKHKRGVEVGVDDTVSNIAIQFTTYKKSGVKLKKFKETRDRLVGSGVVDDIVLIKFPMKYLFDYYQLWLEDDMPPGGPFQYGTIEIRRNLFYKVLENVSKIRPEINAEELWQEIEPGLQVREAGDSD